MVQKYEERHPHIPARHLVDRIVLGGSDGIIENIAATAALNGAGADFGTIILAGLAFAFAGAFSMFFSNYLSRRSELDSLRIDVERERMEIETEPEEEREELEDLLRKEGYKQEEVDVIMSRLTKDKDMWLRAQLRHELHLHLDELHSSPFTKSIPAGIAFLLGALIPVIPYATSFSHISALILSILLSLAFLFFLGASNLFYIEHFNAKRGFESALVGGFAAFLLYIIGRAISIL